MFLSRSDTYCKYTKILTSLILWTIVLGVFLLIPSFPLVVMLAIGIVIQSVIVVFPKLDIILTSLHKKKKQEEIFEKKENQK